MCTDVVRRLARRDAVSLKSLQAEYESVQHHLEELIQESELLSSALRQTLTQEGRGRKGGEAVGNSR
jgi:hypothetical protein